MINMFNKDSYIRKNKTMNYPNFMANLNYFVQTIWMRSSEENAEGLQFFADLWRTEGLIHKGAITSKPKKATKKQSATKSAE